MYIIMSLLVSELLVRWLCLLQENTFQNKKALVIQAQDRCHGLYDRKLASKSSV